MRSVPNRLSGPSGTGFMALLMIGGIFSLVAYAGKVLLFTGIIFGIGYGIYRLFNKLGGE